MRDRVPSLTAAMSAPAIWGPFFKGESFANWRVFLKALMAEPLDEAELAAYQHFTGRQTPSTTPFTEAALVCGRRAGKTRIIALVAAFLACFRNYERWLAPGEIATVAVISVDRKQARVAFRYISGMINAVPALASMVVAEDGEKILLQNRVQIEVHTASFRVTRGYTFAAVLADETAFWRNEEAKNPDTEIFRALRPGLSNIPGAILLNASSPYMRTGVLYNTWRRHWAKDDGRVLVWQSPTAEMNPLVPADVIAEAYEDDPASAASEYGAQFRDDIAAFVDRDTVLACVEDGCLERPPNRAAGRWYVAFVDAAGGSGQDSMTMAIAHREGDVAVLDAVRERRPPFSPTDVVLEFSGLMAQYGISRAESDKWGGDWVTEAFRNYRITVVPSAKPKSDIYRELLPLINARRAMLADVPRLIGQLCGLERRVGRGGKDSIDHGPNMHDDVANAAAGALVGALVGRQPVRISEEMLRMARSPSLLFSGHKLSNSNRVIYK